jgi:hypothetical protein
MILERRGILSSAFATPSGECNGALATAIEQLDLHCGNEKLTWIDSIDIEQ